MLSISPLEIKMSESTLARKFVNFYYRRLAEQPHVLSDLYSKESIVQFRINNVIIPIHSFN